MDPHLQVPSEYCDVGSGFDESTSNKVAAYPSLKSHVSGVLRIHHAGVCQAQYRKREKSSVGLLSIDASSVCPEPIDGNVLLRNTSHDSLCMKGGNRGEKIQKRNDADFRSVLKSPKSGEYTTPQAAEERGERIEYLFFTPSLCTNIPTVPIPSMQML